MDDIRAPPVSTKGTVRGVDDIGSIMVSWDKGSSLSIAYGEDSCRRTSEKNIKSNICNLCIDNRTKKLYIYNIKL